MQNHDILIRRKIGVSTQGEGTREFFTLHRHPSEQKLGGPWDDEQFACAKAQEMALADGCTAWLESAAAPGTFHNLPD